MFELFTMTMSGLPLLGGHPMSRLGWIVDRLVFFSVQFLPWSTNICLKPLAEFLAAPAHSSVIRSCLSMCRALTIGWVHCPLMCTAESIPCPHMHKLGMFVFRGWPWLLEVNTLLYMCCSHVVSALLESF